MRKQEHKNRFDRLSKRLILSKLNDNKVRDRHQNIDRDWSFNLEKRILNIKNKKSKILYKHFTPAFVIHSTRTQIQKVILYSKTGFKRAFKNFCYKNKSNSDLVWNIQLISNKG